MEDQCQLARKLTHAAKSECWMQYRASTGRSREIRRTIQVPDAILDLAVNYFFPLSYEEEENFFNMLNRTL